MRYGPFYLIFTKVPSATEKNYLTVGGPGINRTQFTNILRTKNV
jgi:hypothetical protein